MNISMVSPIPVPQPRLAASGDAGAAVAAAAVVQQLRPVAVALAQRLDTTV